MSATDLNWIANYIWGIADDVLRDLYVRGKYRDVILPIADAIKSGTYLLYDGARFTRSSAVLSINIPPRTARSAARSWGGTLRGSAIRLCCGWLLPVARGLRFHSEACRCSPGWSDKVFEFHDRPTVGPAAPNFEAVT